MPEVSLVAVSTQNKVTSAMSGANANYDVLVQAIPVTYVLEALELTT